MLWIVALLTFAEPPVAPGSLTLPQALALADQGHIDERLAELGLAQAGQDKRLSYQYVLPRLDLIGQVSRQYSAPQTAISVFPSLNAAGAIAFQSSRVELPGYDQPNYNLGLRLTQPLFDGGRWWNAIARGDSDYAAAEEQRREARLQMRGTVAHLFYELVRAQRSLAILQVNVQRSDEQLARAQALFEAARGPKSDVFAARANLANDQIAVTQQQQRVELARVSLNLAIGLDSGALTAAEPPALTVSPAVVVAAEVESQAVEQRPLLAALRRQVESADTQAKVVRADYFPVLNAQGTYLRSSPDVGLVFGNPGRQYVATATLNLSWNLFAGQVTSVAVEKAHIAVSQAQAQLLKNERLVREQAARAATSLERGRETLGLATVAHAAAAEGLELARERFNAGAASNLEVRDAQLKLTSAELNLVSTRIDVQLAAIDIEAAIGRL
jgi:outer membrane protein